MPVRKAPVKKSAAPNTLAEMNAARKAAVSKRAATKAPAKKRVAKTNVPVTDQDTLRTAAAAHMKGQKYWPWPLRPMQQEAYNAFSKGIKRFGLFWHRRAGKDVFGMSVARQQMVERVGSYVHFFPKHVHAKRALWRGVDPRKGAKFIDIAFHDIEEQRNNQDMLIEAYNGSTWALLGSDNYDSTVIGGNVVGVVFSEWALCDPRAWDYIRPILRENKGWAMFITTFRGRNHAWQMYESLKDNPDWYIDKRTIEQTCDIEGNRIITDADVEADRRDGMKESLIQQEYYCNPEATSDGAIYGSEVARLRGDQARHSAVWTPGRPVYCVWSLDIPIQASYVLVQPGLRASILKAHTMQFTTLSDALAHSERHRYPIQKHIISGKQRDYISGFNDLDRSPDVLANSNIIIEQASTSSLLETCLIDLEQCNSLLDSLGGYVRRESFSQQVGELHYSDNPVDSWHKYLVQALETWAAYDYSGAREWRSNPNYKQMDRLARTVR